MKGQSLCTVRKYSENFTGWLHIKNASAQTQIIIQHEFNFHDERVTRSSRYLMVTQGLSKGLKFDSVWFDLGITVFAGPNAGVCIETTSLTWYPPPQS